MRGISSRHGRPGRVRGSVVEIAGACCEGGFRAKRKSAGGIALVVAAVMLALSLVSAAFLVTGCAGKEKETSGGETPLELAQEFLKAVEREDADVFLSCFQPGFTVPEPDPFTGEVKVDPREFMRSSFKTVDFRFEGVELQVAYEEGDSAAVVTAGGKMYMNPLGVEKEIDLGREPLRFEMVREGGRWFLTQNPLPYLT